MKPLREVNSGSNCVNEENNPSTSIKKEASHCTKKQAESWEEFSKRDMSSIVNGGSKKSVSANKNKQTESSTKQYDFFPVFDNKTVADSSITQNIMDTNSEKLKVNDHSKIIIEPMQKLVLHATDNKICDNKSNALSSIGS